MSLYQIQEALGVGRSTAYGLINDNLIRHWRIGSAIKVPKAFLIEYVLQSCGGTSPKGGDV